MLHFVRNVPDKLKLDIEGDKKLLGNSGILECILSFVRCFADEIDRNQPP